MKRVFSILFLIVFICINSTVLSFSSADTLPPPDDKPKGGYTVESNAGANGQIIPSGSVFVDANETKEFVISPNPGYVIKDVLVDGVSFGAINSYTFIDIGKNRSISAIFEQAPHFYKVKACHSGNGTVTPEGVSEVEPGDNIKYLIEPQNGYKIKDVLVDDVSVGAVTEYQFTNVSSNHTIKVIFEKELTVYTIEAIQSEHGSISPKGLTDVVAGEDMEYTITPDDGYHITGIIVNGKNIGAGNKCLFENVDRSYTITATFEKDLEEYIIDSMSNTGGKIYPEKSMKYGNGDSVVYQIKAEEGYEIDELVVDGVRIGPVNSYTFNNIKSNHQISVKFKEKEYIFLEDGEYLVPSSLKGVNNISKKSVVSDAISSTIIDVNDGKWDLNISLNNVKVDSVNRGISKIGFYEDGPNSKLNEIDVVSSKNDSFGNKILSKVRMPLKEGKSGVYLKIYIDSIGFNINSYLLLNLNKLSTISRDVPTPVYEDYSDDESSTNENTTDKNKNEANKSKNGFNNNPNDSQSESDNTDLTNTISNNRLDIEYIKNDKDDKNTDNKNSSLESDNTDSSTNVDTDNSADDSVPEQSDENSIENKMYVVEVDGTNNTISMFTVISIAFSSLIVIIGYYLHSIKK